MTVSFTHATRPDIDLGEVGDQLPILLESSSPPDYDGQWDECVKQRCTDLEGDVAEDKWEYKSSRQWLDRWHRDVMNGPRPAKVGKARVQARIGEDATAMDFEVQLVRLRADLAVRENRRRHAARTHKRRSRRGGPAWTARSGQTSFA